jgi:hypothetical protein
MKENVLTVRFGNKTVSLFWAIPFDLADELDLDPLYFMRELIDGFCGYLASDGRFRRRFCLSWSVLGAYRGWPGFLPALGASFGWCELDIAQFLGQSTLLRHGKEKGLSTLLAYQLSVAKHHAGLLYVTAPCIDC